MMDLPVTSTFLALFTLYYTALSAYVIRLRGRYRVSLGDGNTVELQKAISVHSNFSQYVPLAMLLMGYLEYQSASNGILILVGLMLGLGRLLHGYGIILSRKPGGNKGRVFGMAFTFTSLSVMALYLLALVFIIHK